MGYLTREQGDFGRPYLVKDVDAVPTAAQKATSAREGKALRLRPAACEAWVIADGTGNVEAVYTRGERVLAVLIVAPDGAIIERNGGA